MSYDRYKSREIVKIFNENYSSIYSEDRQVYTTNDCVEYVEPLQKIRILLSQQFLYNRELEAVDLETVWEDGVIECMYIAELGFLIRDIVASERTFIGLLGSLLQNGKLDRIVRRLGTLSGFKG